MPVIKKAAIIPDYNDFICTRSPTSAAATSFDAAALRRRIYVRTAKT